MGSIFGKRACLNLAPFPQMDVSLGSFKSFQSICISKNLQAAALSYTYRYREAPHTHPHIHFGSRRATSKRSNI